MRRATAPTAVYGLSLWRTQPHRLRAGRPRLGHPDPRSTRRYAKLREERLLEVVRPRVVH